jgi:hypothetical protein
MDYSLEIGFGPIMPVAPHTRAKNILIRRSAPVDKLGKPGSWPAYRRIQTSAATIGLSTSLSSEPHRPSNAPMTHKPAKPTYPRSSALIGGQFFLSAISAPLQNPGHSTSRFIFRPF